MFRRVFFFLAMNVAVLATVSLVLNLLGVQPYLTSNGLDYESLMVFCLVWGMAGSFISLLMSKFIAKKMMGVQIVDDRGQHAKLVQTIHKLSRAAHLPKVPEVGIYESPEVNAFATGPSKSNSLVAVSTGLLHTLSDDEIEGVLGHEIAHIANGDMVTMTLIQGVINAFVMFFARIAAFALQNVLNSDDDEKGSSAVGGMSYYITTFVFEIIFGFIGMFVISYFSRLREFRADKGGASLAGKEKMINALKKLESQLERGVIDDRNKNMNAMKISSSDGIMAMLSTHPKLKDRIRTLEMSR